MSGPARFKDPKPPKPRKGGRARPDEPLAEWCQVAVAGVCWGRADQRHHKLRRGQGGGDEAANTLDVCTGCHDQIHHETGWAYRMGYLVRSSSPLTER